MSAKVIVSPAAMVPCESSGTAGPECQLAVAGKVGHLQQAGIDRDYAIVLQHAGSTRNALSLSVSVPLFVSVPPATSVLLPVTCHDAPLSIVMCPNSI